MSLRLVPSSAHPTSTTNTSTQSSSSTQELSRGAPSAPGLHDTLRSSTSQDPSSSSTHPLETRLSQWTQTQSQLQSQLLRRNFGIAEPLRRGMELKMVREADNFRPSTLGAPSRVHSDILTGRDSEISWEDVYAGQDGVKMADGGQGVQGWQEEMELKVGMGKW